MRDLLAFGLQNVLLPLVVWCATFALVAVFAGVLTAWWSSRHLRPPAAASLKRSRTRVWCGRMILAMGCFALPLFISAFHAVPFAIERGLASGIEGAVPSATGWIADVATRNTMSLLAVGDQDTVIDIRAMRTRVADALESLRASSSRTSIEGFEALAETEFLTVVQRTLDSVSAPDGRVTWRTVATTARSRASTDGVAMFSNLIFALRATASGHMYWAVLLIAACQVVAFVLFRFVVHPIAPPEPAEVM